MALVDPSKLRVARVEGPKDLIERFRVRELHPNAEIVETVHTDESLWLAYELEEVKDNGETDPGQRRQPDR